MGAQAPGGTGMTVTIQEEKKPKHWGGGPVKTVIDSEWTRYLDKSIRERRSKPTNGRIHFPDPEICICKNCPCSAYECLKKGEVCCTRPKGNYD